MMDPIVLEEASSSTARHGGGGGGGRAIDRHNPIIRDEKRLGQGLILPSSSTITITTPDRSHHHQKKQSSKETTKKNHKPVAETGDQNRKSIAFADDDQSPNIEKITGPGDFISPPTSSRYLLSDKAMLNFSSELDTIWAPSLPRPPPPLHEPLKSHDGKTFKKKSHDLEQSYAPPTTPPPPPPQPPCTPFKFHYGNALKKKDDDSLASSPPKPQPPPSPPREPLKFLNGKAFKKKDDDSLSSSPPKPPSQRPPPPESLQFHNREALKKKDDDSLSFPPPKSPSPPHPLSSHQVVVLEVSLHCRGCERKMRKHISKIEGVTSFKTEFAAKKVTVVGDVTPLAVLTSVLKVKNAKLLTPATLLSSPDHSSTT